MNTPDTLIITCTGVREYSEAMPVTIMPGEGHWGSGPKESWEGRGRLVVRAVNEGGYNCTDVDLLELLSFVKQHMTAVWNSVP